MKAFKPMLASPCETGDIAKLKFPLLASPKLDGIRSVVLGGALLSRKLKPIPNHYCQSLFARPELNNLDGELIVGDAHTEGVYNRTTSGVMSHDGEPDVTYYVFDYIDENLGFTNRQSILKSFVKDLPISLRKHIKVVEQVEINSAEELLAYEAKCIAEGYEGIMLRSPYGPYKFGRSTLKEGYLLKVKQFSDMEAVIIDCEERFSNQNEEKRNALGQIERSTAKAGKVATNSLGAFVCTADGYDLAFNVGSGFTEEMRQEFWKDRKNLLGKMVKIKYQPSGEKDAPRFPVFLGFRSEIDV